MQDIEGLLFAILRNSRKVFSATGANVSGHERFYGNGRSYLHGHPQWRRKVITTGLPSLLGSSSLGEDGALEPGSGIGDSLS